MTFIGLHKETRERIYITEVAAPREQLRFGDYVCQVCGEILVIKAGLIVRPHFAHMALCKSEYQSHPESIDHQNAKVFLAKKLREAFKEYSGATIEYEVPIPEVKRIADLLTTFRNGWRQADEVQFSPTTIEELEERTNDYARAGIDVRWWLGKGANTPANREWCRKRFGEVFSLSVLE